MKLVGEQDRRQRRPVDNSFIQVHASPCYDLLVSLRALYNVGTYERAGRWAAKARRAMGADLYEEGRLFFQGNETGLGLGLLRVIPELGPESSPSAFIERLREKSVEDVALLMLDTGELSSDGLKFYRSVLEDKRPVSADQRIQEFAGSMADRVLVVLEDPSGSKDRIIAFLERYLDIVFKPIVESIGAAVSTAAGSATDLLAMQPTLSTVEALTGGYTVSETLETGKIILAPSVFIYPFMASRFDEQAASTLIVFGIRNDEILGYRPSDSQQLLRSLKVLANPHRLEILSLLRNGPLLGTEFMKLLGLSQPTVHHHLARLRSAGLIRQERVNEGMFYSLRPETTEVFIGELTHFFGLKTH